MAYARTAIPFFELANAAYASGTISFFAVDPTTNVRLTTLITLYAAKTGTTTVTNPYTLDSDGKFSAPVYAEDRFICVVTDIDGQQHTTGIWSPAISDIDVAAAAASATAAATSETTAGVYAATATTAAATAVAAAASAVAAVGAVKITALDPLAEVLDNKITVSGLASKSNSPTTATQVMTIGVAPATDVQAVAKSSVTTALTPANLAALGADTVTSGLTRLSTVAEATTGTASNISVTPAGLAAALGNTITQVTALAAGFTLVSSGANVTMARFQRYRINATVAAQVNLPTTYVANDWNIVEFACTTGATLTVGRGGHTIDGAAANDTCTRYGDIVTYHCTAAGVVRTIHSGYLPIS